MKSIQQLAHAVLANVLRPAPYSEAKLQCAWRLSVGPDLARASQVAAADGTVSATVDDARWHREVHRSRVLIGERLRAILGDAVARDFRVLPTGGDVRRSRGARGRTMGEEP